MNGQILSPLQPQFTVEYLNYIIIFSRVPEKQALVIIIVLSLLTGGRIIHVLEKLNFWTDTMCNILNSSHVLQGLMV